jgi:hypothetical protein
MLNKSLEFDYERKIKYQNVVEKAMDDTAILFNKAQADNKIDDFANFLNDILLNFYNGEINHSDLNEFQSKFVEPLKKGIIHNFNHLEEAVKLAQALKNATYIFSSIIISNETLYEDIKQIYELYNEASTKLEHLAVKLNTEFNR